ncbi:hypothetical protein EV401DRAFT_2071590 [Pisolithus croceorrhizus]|nr:hypothetical protein EV401DRAFT_2071590 [Pisolithus croceorrhizus]
MPNNTSQVLAILHQLATLTGGFSPGGQELLAHLAGIEDALHAATVLMPPVPPPLPLTITHAPPISSTDGPTYVQLQ